MPKPNILFFFPDQMRGDWTELNLKNPIRTPNIRKLENEGVFFSQTYCPSPVCSPSRSCLAVGKDYDRVKIIDNGQNHPFDDPTFYELLRDKAGYHTMTCGKLDLRHPEHNYGNDGKHIVDGIDYLEKWGFSDGVEIGGKLNGARMWRKYRKDIGPYISYLKDRGVAHEYVSDSANRSFKDSHASPLCDADYVDNWIGRSGIELLKNAPNDKPWYIQVNFNGPHNPLDATESMLTKWKDESNFPLPIKCTKFSKKEILDIQRNYAAMIENIDGWIGKFIAEVKKRGELNNTLIIVASDHGEMLGDHNKVTKGVPYEGAIHVPLVISGVGVKHRPIINKPVALIDLFSTILDFAEVEIPTGVNSISLEPVLTGNLDIEVKNRFIRSGLKHFRVIIENNYKLVLGFDYSDKPSFNFKRYLKKKLFKDKDKKKINYKPVYLFDMENDPNELCNVANLNPKIVDRLMKNLVKFNSD
jgi:arylsulfatase A-like enzyme